MKKILSFSLKTFGAFSISFSCAIMFCKDFESFCDVLLFGGLFLALVFGVFDD